MQKSKSMQKLLHALNYLMKDQCLCKNYFVVNVLKNDDRKLVERGVLMTYFEEAFLALAFWPHYIFWALAPARSDFT